MTSGPIVMNNRTRVITSLRHKQPDRVPYNIWFNKGMLAKMVEFSGEPDFAANVGNCFVDVVYGFTNSFSRRQTFDKKEIWTCVAW